MKLKYEKNKKDDVQSVIEAISRKEKLLQTGNAFDLNSFVQSLAQKRLENERESNN